MNYNENNIKIFLRSFCNCILENEEKIKQQRIKLNALFCFSDSYGYFKYLDKNQKNYIDKSDISLFLSLNKIKVSKQIFNNIFNRYDKDGDSSWNFSEYLNFINKDLNNNCNYNNLYPKENNIQNYEKELAKLFELEISYIKYIGIKVKALKELINDKNINTKIIFDLIKKNNDKSYIDVNSLILFLNDGEYHLDKEKAYKLILIISNGKNFLTEKNLDNIFKYDKYVNDSELVYPKYYKNFDYKNASIFQKYKKEFPLNDFGITNYSVYNIPNDIKIKDKLCEDNEKRKYNFNEIQNIIINDNVSDEYNKKFFETNIIYNDNNLKENPLLISNNSNSQKENLYSFTLNEFSFRK